MDGEQPTAGSGADFDVTAQWPIKVCPLCSVQSQTAGNFCPRCGASYNGAGPRPAISRRIVIGVVATLVVIGSTTGIALKVSHDHQATAQRVAAAQAQERTIAKAKAKADAADAVVANLEEEIATSYNKMFSDPENSSYRPGKSVDRTTCVSSGERLFDCETVFSDTSRHAYTILTSADGKTWVAKDGKDL